MARQWVPVPRVRAHDINVYKQAVDQSSSIEDDVKQVLKNARDALEHIKLSEADKEDATDDLGKLTAELEKDDKDIGRVQRYWNRIKEIAPPVAAILSAATSIAKLLGG